MPLPSMTALRAGAHTLALLTVLACSSDPESPPLSTGGTGAGGSGVSAGGGGAAATTGGSAISAGGGGTGGAAGGTTAGGTGGTAGAGGSGGTGGSSGSAGAGGSSGSAPQMSPGEVAFRANCLACHGELGVGTALAPDIQHPIRDYATWVVRNGRAMSTYAMPMQAWTTDKLSDSDLMLIFAYLDTPPKGTTGQALFKDFCANCHGADAKGGVVKHDITNETGEIPMRVRNGAHAGEFEEREEFMPVFSTAILSDSEVELIRAYVDSL